MITQITIKHEERIFDPLRYASTLINRRLNVDESPESLFPSCPPQPPIESLGNKSLPSNKNVVLSSLEHRVANLKAELDISKVYDISDEGD